MGTDTNVANCSQEMNFKLRGQVWKLERIFVLQQNHFHQPPAAFGSTPQPKQHEQVCQHHCSAAAFTTHFNGKTHRRKL